MCWAGVGGGEGEGNVNERRRAAKIKDFIVEPSIYSIGP